MTNFDSPPYRWVLKKKHKRLKYFKRRPMTELEFVSACLNLSDEEMKYYVPGTFKQEDTKEGIQFSGTLRLGFGSPEFRIED